MTLRCLTLLTLAAATTALAQPPAPAPKPKVKPKFELPYLPHMYDFEFDLPRFEFDLWPGYEPFNLDLDFKNKLEFNWAPMADAWAKVDVMAHQDLADRAQEQAWKGVEAAKLAEKMADNLNWVHTPGARSRWLNAIPGQGSPEDSAYRAAREVLSRYEYRRASELLGSFITRYPKSRHAPAAMYWRAFSLYRVGTSPDLEQALRVLDAQREQYPDAVQDPDVAGLTTRVLGALAARGNTAAANRLREHQQGAGTCDKEDMEVRAEALSALVQSDPASAAPVLRRTLARRDECSAPLRRRAVYLLGREGVGGTAEDLVEVARNDPDRSVRSDALSRLAQMPGDGPVRQLEVLLTTGTDERTQRAALNALRNSEHPDAAGILRRAIQREDLPDQVRADAIRSLARRSRTTYAVRPGESGKRSEVTLSQEDMTLLRGLYDRSTSRVIRSAILETMASASGPEADAWLASIVRNQNEELRYRSAALGRLRRSDVALEELTRLYDTLSERELRGELIRILGQRTEPAATDKLIDIAKTGTDPVIRRAAISALSKKDDPRTTKLLLELVEKP